MLSWLKLAAFFAALGISMTVTSIVDAMPKNSIDSVSTPGKKISRAKPHSVTSKKVKAGGVRTQSKAGKAKKIRAPKKTAAVKRAPVTNANGKRPDVKSGAAFVIEQAGGGALFQKNAAAVVPIASITKLMTAMVVLDSQPNLRANISISEEDIDYLRGSRSRLQVGAAMTRETALLLALMSSENRAAHALARHYPGGMLAFMAAMNDKAYLLGMRSTRFDDPTGLSGNNVSTARDLARMVSAAYRYPLIREFSTTPEAVVEIAGQPIEFHNTNPLVKNAGWNVGLSKTGYINEAGKCLVMQARVAGKPVVIVLLDSTGTLTRVGDANRIKRWMEATLARRDTRTRQVSFKSPNARPG